MVNLLYVVYFLCYQICTIIHFISQVKHGLLTFEVCRIFIWQRHVRLAKGESLEDLRIKKEVWVWVFDWESLEKRSPYLPVLFTNVFLGYRVCTTWFWIWHWIFFFFFFLLPHNLDLKSEIWTFISVLFVCLFMGDISQINLLFSTPMYIINEWLQGFFFFPFWEYD